VPRAFRTGEVRILLALSEKELSLEGFCRAFRRLSLSALAARLRCCGESTSSVEPVLEWFAEPMACILTDVTDGSTIWDEGWGGPVGERRAGVEGTEGLEMLVGLDDTLEEGGSVGGVGSEGATRGEGALEVKPELSLEVELARSSTTDNAGCVS
jgi:hypothetical protein